MRWINFILLLSFLAVTGFADTCVQHINTDACAVGSSIFSSGCEVSPDTNARPMGACFRTYGSGPCQSTPKNIYKQITDRFGQTQCVLDVDATGSGSNPCGAQPSTFRRIKDGGGCCVPAGCYRVGPAGFFSNGRCHSCPFLGTQMQGICGTSVFTNLTARSDHAENVMDGQCQ